MRPPRKRVPDIEIMRRMLEKHSEPVPECGCWIWTSRGHRYGQIRLYAGYKKSRVIIASRAAWIVKNGPVPEGMLVCHKCDTPRCVNPDHLFLGTMKDNCADMLRKGRHKCWHGRGMERPNAKLTDDDVRAIFNSEDSLDVLAQRFDIHRMHVASIRRAAMWKHITVPLMEQKNEADQHKD